MATICLIAFAFFAGVADCFHGGASLSPHLSAKHTFKLCSTDRPHKFLVMSSSKSESASTAASAVPAVSPVAVPPKPPSAPPAAGPALTAIANPLLVGLAPADRPNIPVSFEDVSKAAHDIRGAVYVTACARNPELSELTGCDLWLKVGRDVRRHHLFGLACLERLLPRNTS